MNLDTDLENMDNILGFGNLSLMLILSALLVSHEIPRCECVAVAEVTQQPGR